MEMSFQLTSKTRFTEEISTNADLQFALALASFSRLWPTVELSTCCKVGPLSCLRAIRNELPQTEKNLGGEGRMAHSRSPLATHPVQGQPGLHEVISENKNRVHLNAGRSLGSGLHPLSRNTSQPHIGSRNASLPPKN